MILGFMTQSYRWDFISNDIGFLCYITLCLNFFGFLVACITWIQKFQIFVIFAFYKNQGCDSKPTNTY